LYEPTQSSVSDDVCNLSRPLVVVAVSVATSYFLEIPQYVSLTSSMCCSSFFVLVNVLARLQFGL